MKKKCKGCGRWFDGLPSEDYCDECVSDEENLMPWDYVTEEEEKESSIVNQEHEWVCEKCGLVYFKDVGVCNGNYEDGVCRGKLRKRRKLNKEGSETNMKCPKCGQKMRNKGYFWECEKCGYRDSYLKVG